MPAPRLDLNASFQLQFHHRWNHLNDPHVRALAWLLDAPDLLDPQAPKWRGKIATLGPNAAQDVEGWLAELDRTPDVLHTYLAVQPFTRLGRYAEKLMAFYFQHQGILLAHGLQVRAGKTDTVGEFDFLLRHGDDLVHWEFATKFYLLAPSGAGQEPDYFIGPNLADTLGAKMHKILNQQLSLAQHPAAQRHLPQSVVAAQALVKGWLFYHGDNSMPAQSVGVSENHCRGFWCPLAELDACVSGRSAILNRLNWLAPAKTTVAQSLDMPTLRDILTAHFARDTMPVMLALLAPQGDCLIETGRGFVVPNDWHSRAGERILRTIALSK